MGILIKIQGVWRRGHDREWERVDVGDSSEREPEDVAGFGSGIRGSIFRLRDFD